MVVPLISFAEAESIALGAVAFRPFFTMASGFCSCTSCSRSLISVLVFSSKLFIAAVGLCSYCLRYSFGPVVLLVLLVVPETGISVQFRCWAFGHANRSSNLLTMGFGFRAKYSSRFVLYYRKRFRISTLRVLFDW